MLIVYESFLTFIILFFIIDSFFSGDILMFMPGQEDIEVTSALLQGEQHCLLIKHIYIYIYGCVYSLCNFVCI